MSDSNQLRVAVLISGRGSNLEALLKRAHTYEVVLVGSNKGDAAGLTFAKEREIPTVIASRAEYTSKEGAQAALAEAITARTVDLVVLAGFMQILTTEFVNRFAPRLINIHPSLLPKYPGLDPHARALAAEEDVHGCTVHMVDNGVDTGAVIAQSRLTILPTETIESLEIRTRRLEHDLYPWVVEQIAQGGIQLTSSGPRFTPEAHLAGRLLGYLLP